MSMMYSLSPRHCSPSGVRENAFPFGQFLDGVGREEVSVKAEDREDVANEDAVENGDSANVDLDVCIRVVHSGDTVVAVVAVVLLGQGVLAAKDTVFSPDDDVVLRERHYAFGV